MVPTVQMILQHFCMSFVGLAQCAELNWQLRGLADKRQVPGAKVALQHNLGLGGAAVVTIYRHGFPQYARYVVTRGALPWLPSIDMASHSMLGML